MILAGIDIGTNTLRLLIADIGSETFTELSSLRALTRLGQGLERSGRLSDEARERTLTALERFSGAVRDYPGVVVDAVGTSALRNASNAAEFVSAVRARTGIAVRVISGGEEARLTLSGVRRALSQGAVCSPLRSTVLADIGGGSTEIIVTDDDGDIRSEQSLEMGAVSLHERFLRSDPPADSEIRELRNAVRERLNAWEEELLRDTALRATMPAVCAGTAGTVTTLAAMDLGLSAYDPARINGHILTAAALNRLVGLLARTPVRERTCLAGLEQGREDIILAGAVVAQEVLARCGKQRMLVSDWGLREGIVFGLFDRLRSGGDRR